MTPGGRRHTLSIRRTVHRGAEGWAIVGHKVAGEGWPVSVFVAGPRADAETVKQRLLDGCDGNLFDGLSADA